MKAQMIRQETVQAASYQRISLKAFSSVTVETNDARGKVTVNLPSQAFIRADGTLTVQGPLGNPRNWNRRTVERRPGHFTVTAAEGQGNIVAFYDETGEQVEVYDAPTADQISAFLDVLLNGWGHPDA